MTTLPTTDTLTPDQPADQVGTVDQLRAELAACAQHRDQALALAEERTRERNAWADGADERDAVIDDLQRDRGAARLKGIVLGVAAMALAVGYALILIHQTDEPRHD